MLRRLPPVASRPVFRETESMRIVRGRRVMPAILVGGAIGFMVAACVGDEPDAAPTTNPLPEASTGLDATLPDAGTEDLRDSGSPDALPDVTIDAAGSAYAAAVAADNPVAYLRLGDVAATELEDEKQLYNGTISGTGVTLGVAGATSDNNTAVSLTGGNGCIDLNDVLDFAGSTFSLEVWVKPDDFPELTGLVVKIADPAGWAMTIGTDGKVTMGVGTQGMQSSAVLSKTAFTHVVAVWGATTGELYFNGTQVGMTTVNQKPPATNAHLGLGCFFNTGNGRYGVLRGTLDEVALYDRALTAARVTAHFEAAKK